MPESTPGSSRIASWLLELFVPLNRADSITGDLLEEFSHRAAQSGRSAAVRWYRRQVVKSIAHLLLLQLRIKPWAMLGVVLSALALQYYSVRAVESAVALFLAHVPVYRYLAPRPFWLIYAVGMEVILCPLAAGWISATVSKDREMAVGLTLAVLRGAALVPWLIFVIWRRPPDIPWVHSDAFYVQSIVFLLLPPVCLLAGAVIFRKRRSAVWRRLLPA